MRIKTTFKGKDIIRPISSKSTEATISEKTVSLIYSVFGDNSKFAVKKCETEKEICIALQKRHVSKTDIENLGTSN